MNATKRPWKVIGVRQHTAIVGKIAANDSDTFPLFVSGEHQTNYDSVKANAALIVRAVNTFDAAKAALNRAYGLEVANHGMTSHAYEYKAVLAQMDEREP